MNKQDILHEVFRQLKKVAPDSDPSALGPTDNIKESLGINSGDFSQFVMAISRKFNIEIPEEEYGKTTTLKSLVSYIYKKLNPHGADKTEGIP